MKDNALPDYLAALENNALPDYLEKSVVEEGSPRPHEIALRMWRTIEMSLEELGKYPQHFRYTSRPRQGGTVSPKSQPFLIYFYIAEELRERLRYIRLTFAYRLQGTIEDIAEALKAGRLTSLALPTRSLMEVCAVLKDVRRKQAQELGAVLKMHARGLADALSRSVDRSLSENERAKAKNEAQETFNVLARALEPAEEFMTAVKSDMVLNDWRKRGMDWDTPKPTNILTLIDNRLAFSDSSPRHYYEMLSEMAHPNMFSFNLFWGEHREYPDGVTTMNVEARPLSAKVVLLVLLTIAEPIWECVPQALSDLAEMNREIEAVGRLGRQLRHYLGRFGN